MFGQVLGLRNAVQLAAFETAKTAQRIYELQKTPVVGKFDTTHLKTIHQRMFQDVFPWAGEFRTTMLGKAERVGQPPTWFTLPHLLEHEAQREFSAINRLIVVEGDGPQSKGVILFQSVFYSGDEGLALEFGSWERPTWRAGPPLSRYCLSHFPPRSTTSNRIGPMRARKPLCATARFACRIPSSVTGAGANRLMMSTTIGSGFAAVFATAAAQHSPSCRRFLRPTAITASSLAARRYSATS